MNPDAAQPVRRQRSRCAPPSPTSGRGRPAQARRRRAAARRRTRSSPPAARTLRTAGADAGRELGAQAGERVAQQPPDHLHQPLAHLQRDVPREAVADDDVGRAGVDVARLDVAGEVEAARLQEAVGLAGQLVALGLFLADREQPHARPVDAERQAGVDGTHRRELHEVPGPAAGIRAHVEQHRRAVPGRNRGRQRRPLDAGDHAERRVGRHDGGAGVPGAEQRRGIAPPRPPGPPPRSTRRAAAAARPSAARPSRPRRPRGRPRRRAGRSPAVPTASGGPVGLGPTSASGTPPSRAASSAPSSTVPGPRSPPIASTAMRNIASPRAAAARYPSLTSRTCRPR